MKNNNEEKTSIPVKKTQSDNEAIVVESVVSDSWITDKVKSSLVYTKQVPGLSIKVSTHDGVVTLSGRVDNQAEHTSAIKTAKNIKGVKSIITKDLIFEIVKAPVH